MDLFIRHPWAAFIPAPLFLLLWRVRRRGLCAAAAGAWACYGVYEYGMRLRWLCSGECNIRVDLLIAYPLLLAFSLAGLAAAARRTEEGRP